MQRGKMAENGKEVISHHEQLNEDNTQRYIGSNTHMSIDHPLRKTKMIDFYDMETTNNCSPLSYLSNKSTQAGI